MAVFDWYAEKRNHKKVTLCNVQMCKTITCNNIIASLDGMGFFQWRRYLSYAFSDAVVKALERGENNADITKMFSCDLVCINSEGEHTKSQEEICACLMDKLFRTISETDEELIVSIRTSGLR